MFSVLSKWFVYSWACSGWAEMVRREGKEGYVKKTLGFGVTDMQTNLSLSDWKSLYIPVLKGVLKRTFVLCCPGALGSSWIGAKTTLSLFFFFFNLLLSTFPEEISQVSSFHHPLPRKLKKEEKREWREGSRQKIRNIFVQFHSNIPDRNIPTTIPPAALFNCFDSRHW